MPTEVNKCIFRESIFAILNFATLVSHSQWSPTLIKSANPSFDTTLEGFCQPDNYVDYETGSMTGILKQLKWESLKKRRKYSRLIMLYKGLKGAASIPTNDLVPPIRRTRNHHSLAFQIPMAGTDIYKSSFFPQTIRDWNLLTDSLISTSECAVDSVTKFTSLVRARD